MADHCYDETSPQREARRREGGMKAWLITATAIVLAGGQALRAEEGGSPGEWTTFRHPRVIVFFPSDWQIREDPPGGIVEGASPLTGPDDRFREKLLIGMEKLPEGSSREGYISQSRSALLSGLADAEILGEKSVRYGDLDGTEIELVHRTGGPETFLRILFLETDGWMLVATQSGRAPDYERFLPVFDRILSALEPMPEIFPRTYPHERFVIQFPASWSVKTGLPGTVVALMSPKSSGSDPFHERVTVGVEKLDGRMSFDEYVEKNFEVLLTRLRGARKINEGRLSLPAGEAAELELSHRSTGPRTVLRVVLLQSGPYAFSLICAGQEPEYNAMRPTFDAILNSFASPLPPGHADEP